MSDDRAAYRKASKAAQKLAQENRLAAKLRENLRLRKAQVRSRPADVPGDAVSDHDSESVRLPKAPPES